MFVDVFGSGSIARFLDMLRIWLAFRKFEEKSISASTEAPCLADIPLNHLVLAERSNTLLVNPDSETFHLGLESIPIELGNSSMNRRRDFPPRSLAGRGRDRKVPHGIDRLLGHSEESRVKRAGGEKGFAGEWQCAREAKEHMSTPSLADMNERPCECFRLQSSCHTPSEAEDRNSDNLKQQASDRRRSFPRPPNCGKR